MPQFPQLEKRICTQPIKVPRSALRLIPKLNPRKNYGDLSRLGASLDACLQLTVPLIVVESAPGVFDVRDGHRRVVAVDQGYAPRFLEVNGDEWDCLLLCTPEGSIPHERDIRRWCAATNISRKNWLPIEKALFYQQEIEDAIQDRIDEINLKLPEESYITELRPQEEKKIRKSTKLLLASMEGRRSEQTIQNHLLLLELPACIQEQLFKGNISQDAALRFRGMDEKEALLVLREVAKKDNVDLTSSQIPGDVLAPTRANDEVHDVFIKDDAPWFVPVQIKQKTGTSGRSTRTIRAKAVDQVKRIKGFKGRKSNKRQLRTLGEIQEEIDRLLESYEDLSDEQQTKLKTLRWMLLENNNLPS